jgi:hypothetical protein
VGLAFGLGAALCWGLADFFAALAARRIGTLRVVIGFHALAMAVLAAMVIATGALADVGWADLRRSCSSAASAGSLTWRSTGP